MAENPSSTVVIQNKKGLHARAAAKFVKIVSAYDASVSVVKIPKKGAASEEVNVSGTSILGLMMLGAESGSSLKLTGTGKHAEELVKALVTLIEQKFGESE